MVVEGEVRMGGQERHGFEGATCEEHFYLECNAALAVPSESDEPLGRSFHNVTEAFSACACARLTVHCSSQTAMKTQKFAAHVCGIPYGKAGRAPSELLSSSRLGGLQDQTDGRRLWWQGDSDGDLLIRCRPGGTPIEAARRAAQCPVRIASRSMQKPC